MPSGLSSVEHRKLTMSKVEGQAVPFGHEEPIEALLGRAFDLYRVRLRDNLDLGRLASAEAKARVVGHALMERGDARAFVLGRRLVMASRGKTSGWR